MTADDPTPVVPNLRFPEFHNAGEWETTKLEKLVVIQSGGTPSKANPAFWDGSIPWVSAKDMKRLFLEDTEDHISIAAVADGARLVPAGTLLMLTRGMTLLKDLPICVVGREMSFNQDVKALLPKVDVNGPFLALALLGNKQLLLKMVDIAGHGTGKLNTDELEGFELASPRPAEQQKIADCLRSLDDLIAAERRKLEALRQHRQGLMQQLFPLPGEAVPRLRFPDFHDAQEWQVKRIGDLEAFVTSGSRGWAAFYAPSGSLFVRITNFSRQSIYLDLTSSKYVELPADTSESSRTTLRFDDVLISITADVGIIGYVDADIPSPAYINQHIALVRFDTPKVHGKFVAYFLASEGAQRQFRLATDNGTKAGMNLMAVEAISLLLPPLAEQHRIADCLTSLDACVAKQTQKLDALNQHKKGLLQQLFPSAESP